MMIFEFPYVLSFISPEKSRNFIIRISWRQFNLFILTRRGERKKKNFFSDISDNITRFVSIKFIKNYSLNKKLKKEMSKAIASDTWSQSIIVSTELLNKLR